MNRIFYLGMVAALSLAFLMGLPLIYSNTALAGTPPGTSFRSAPMMTSTNSDIAPAKGEKLVKIEPIGKGNADRVAGIAIAPRTLHVKKNTIVVWKNAIPQREVEVVFQENKPCKDVAPNPNALHFRTARSCFVTNYIPSADTSSLQFTEAGKFDYMVTAGGKLQAKGDIIVQ